MSNEKGNKPVVNEFQPSMTEWFAAIGEEEESNKFREEDNYKVERLEALYQTIRLPYERPLPFSARDLTDKTPAFARLLEERGDELCAIRLVPLREGLPKIRNRGLSVRECYETWFLRQDINPDDYRVFVCPHTDALLWSATFVVKPDIIFGEMIRGLHMQLTHGDTAAPVYRFRFNFKDWEWSMCDAEAETLIKTMLNMIRVDDEGRQKNIRERVNGEFAHNYLQGYFETTVWPGNMLYFIDYNRLLPRYITTPPPFQNRHGISGVVAYQGVAEGRARIVRASNLEDIDFQKGDILLTDNTDVRFIAIMQKAGAIVTDRGGILSHASIVARELKKPCIVGTGRATELIADGDTIRVDAEKGIVEIIS